MATAPNPAHLFGDHPSGPLHYARAILALMSAAWLAEAQALGKATSETVPTEFETLHPRVHADALDAVGCLIDLADLLASES